MSGKNKIVIRFATYLRSGLYVKEKGDWVQLMLPLDLFCFLD